MKRDDEIDDMLARSPWPGRRVGRAHVEMDDLVVGAATGIAILAVSLPGVAIVASAAKAALKWYVN